MAGWRRLGLLLALVAGLLFAIAVVRLAPPQGSAPTGTPSPSPTAGQGGTSLAGRPWFVLSPVHPDQNSLVGFDLIAGALEQRPVKISPRYGPLAPAAEMKGALPFGGGPFGDNLLYAYWTGVTSEVHSLVPATGRDQRLWSGPLIVHDAAVDLASGFVHFLSIDKTSRQPDSIWRLDPTQPDPLVAVAHVPNQLSGPESASQGDLVLTSDGRYVVVLSCPSDCTMNWFRLPDGRRAGARDLGGPFRVVGVSATTVWLAPECGDVACPITSIALDTGRAHELALVCSAAVVVVTNATTLIVSDGAVDGNCVRQDYRLIAFDVAGGDPMTIATLPDRALGLVEGSPNSGIAAPEGWVALGPDGSLVGALSGGSSAAPELVRVSDGFRLPLPALDPAGG